MNKRLLFIVFVLFTIISAVSAQVTTASMSGKVSSKEEAVIGATILAVHEPSGTRYGTITNIDGRFNLQGMRVGGPYKVEISYIGYQPALYKGITLQLGETYVLNVELNESSELLDEVVVTAPKTIERTGATTNISERQLTTLPTITRSISDFTKLSPYAGGTSSFAGRDGRYNTITIDGAALNNSFGLTTNNMPGGDAQAISLDAIDEISVNVSPYDVKYSNFTGASINAVTKSGTNEYKGTFYTYQKPKGFVGSKIDGVDIPNADSYRSSMYGVTLGGPIVKDKLFLFVNGEIESKKSPGLVWHANPNNDGRSDDKTKMSRTWIGDLRTISGFAKTKYGYDTGAYENFDDFASDNWKFMARLDWNINTKHKFTVRLNAVQSDNDQLLNPTSTILTRTNSNRYGVDAFAFANSNYQNSNIVTSITGELNSSFSSKIQNKLLATYSHIRDTRSYNGDPFPYVDIYKDGKQYMTLGTEVFTPFNDVINNVFSIVDNVSASLGNHFLTAGVSFERQYFMNSYLRGPLGYYRYNSMDDFMNDAKPALFGLTYGYEGTDAPGSELTFGMAGLYAQDDWSISPTFRLTYGLRLDMPMYFNSLKGNSAIMEERFVDGTRIDVSKWPKTQVLFSPRVGFNWDVNGDRSIVINGGTGIFTGLLPFVWFTNQPSNSGVIQNTVEFKGDGIPTDFKFEPNYKNTLAKYPDLFPSKANETVPGIIAYVDPEFKMPQVWRSNINVDFQLPADFMLSVGAMYTRDVYNIVQLNMNESNPTGTYAQQPGRVYWEKDKYKYNPAGNVVIKLANGEDKGYQYSFNAVLTKKLDFGLSGMFGYTYTVAKDVTANPGSAPNSAWQNNVAINSLNDPGLSYSLFSTPHRVVGNLAYEVAYAKSWKTTISLFYTGYHTGRYSYTYSNDITGDGNASDLMYVPTSKEEMTFVDKLDKKGNVTYKAKDQADDFWNYIENDSYLKDHKGNFVDRNASLMSWINRFDFRVAEDFYTRIGKRKYGIQVSLDILNVGNLFNSKWGTYKTLGVKNYDNVRLLGTASPVGAPLTYILNAEDRTDFLAKTIWNNSNVVGNAWSMQLGAKVSF